MQPISFTFIKNHALTIEPCVPSHKMCEIVKNWNHYETENNKNIMEYVWNFLSPFIPQRCDKQKLVGYELDRVSLVRNYSKEIKFEKEKRDKKGNPSLITAFVYCEENGAARFHDNGIGFVNPGAKYYQTNMHAGNAVIFTNKVSYQASNNWILKIPIFYKKKVRFNLCKDICSNKKTFEIPTPNGEKYNKVQYIDNGKVVVLSSNLRDENVAKRWNSVLNRKRFLNIEKYKVPSYIDSRRGRPPTDEEEYCPNCFEILSLKPVNYTNCSGCLGPIS